MRLLVLAAFVAAVVAGGAAAHSEKRVPLRIAVGQGGKVTTSDRRLSCPDRCSSTYRRGRVLRLAAAPDTGYRFDHWDGSCIGAAPYCDIALDRKTSVLASFAGLPATVSLMVGGPGRVTSSEGGIDCGDGARACSAQLPVGSTVTLTPVPGNGGRFGGWDGPCASAGTGPCTLRIEFRGTDIAAAFGHSPPHEGPQELTVQGPSPFPITSDPPGIACPPTCTALFPSGTFVTLRTSAGWPPPCTGAEYFGRCALIIDEPTNLTFLYPPPPPAPPPPPPPPTTLLVTVSGGGFITSGLGGIRCGWAPVAQTMCSAQEGGRMIGRLRARPLRWWRFAGWGGLCHGAKLRCSVAIGPGGSYSVTGLFR